MHNDETNEIYQILNKNALFEGFSDSQLKKMIELMHLKSFQPGELIIKEGEISDEIYILKTGLVEIEKIDTHTHEMHKIAQLKAGDVIGEISLLDHASRSASVRALEPTTLYVLSIEAL